MKWFYDLKLTTKIASGFAIILFVAIALGVLGVVNLRTMDEADIAMYELNTAPLENIGNFAVAFQRSRVNLRDMLLDKNDADKKKRIDTINELDKQIENDLKIFESSIRKADIKDECAKLNTAFRKFEPIREKIIDYASRNQNDKAFDLMRGEGLILAQVIDDSISNLFKMKISQAKEKSIQNTKLASFSTSVTIIMIFAGIILSIITALFITRVIRRQLGGEPTEVVYVAGKIADGDFTVKVNVAENDTTSALAAMKKMVIGLEKIISDIIVSSQNLVQAIQEISVGNENLSQRTSEQASSLEEVAATIEETTASINQNAGNAKNANELSEKTSIMAEDGGRVVYEAVSAINEINEASKKIEEIITVINEIAFQTNLLALNAAVEAARAGEQGRGFAVVAGEVRNLAQRSGNAAKEIGTLIKATMVKVEKGTSLANKSGESLKEIISSVKGMTRLVSEIDAASNEQQQGAAQINIAVSELDSMTQQNAGLVEETASASEEIANQAQEMMAMMERFKISQEIKTSSTEMRHKEIHIRTAHNKPISTALNSKKVNGSNNGNGSGENKSSISNKSKSTDIDHILSNEGFEQF